ncbi:thioredoxin domain-containing protein [Microlunatus spumicola]|uniref:Thioredoxin domain-containing protein n=1 Tax=Microlunatus spumicola TaxID=81499 RepID=A0ABP6Y462_9ACTN
MPNRLANATSPYLLQHADNPVDWREWGDEAFAEAERTGKPVLLSVGYAACHWCHVMAHESFEDEATAAQMNARFVNVKVDREERPDVDTVYMAATQALTGQGGWPMTVFLTPDRKPFYAGTYFPPTARQGMPAFSQVLDAVSAAWDDRRDEVVSSAAGIAAQLAEQRLVAAPGAVTPADLDAARQGLERDFDPTYGGFGRAPKFPPSMVLEALLRDGSEQALEMASRTCTAMARGGIYDQLVGGFARYSVDAHWVVPHFEKMLYDNALLLGVYTHLWRRTGDPLASRVVEETVDWLLRELRTPQGAFAASLDADSLDASGHLHEGAFYAWTPEHLVEVLGPEDGAWAARVFAVTTAGTFEHGASTLQRPGVGEDEPERLAGVRARLAEAREQRARPGRDDKVVAAWNGWLVDSLVEAAEVFGRPDWREAARAAAELVWEVHWQADERRLRRTSRDGRPGGAAGILEDHSAVAAAYVRLGCATGDPVWVERARTLLAVVEEQFPDGRGGWFDTAADAEALYTRPQEVTDNATPSGLSATLRALHLMARLTGEDAYARRADEAAATVGALVPRAPRFAGWLWAEAVSEVLPAAAPVEVAVVGPAGPERDALVRLAWDRAPAGSVVVAGEEGAAGFALLEDRSARDGRPTAYVCRGFVCRLPVTDPEALAEQLRTV